MKLDAPRSLEERITELEHRPVAVGSKRVLILLVLVLLAIGATFYYLSGQIQQSAEDTARRVSRKGARTAYENAVAACQRAQPIRVVVYRNTSNAVQHSVQAGDPRAITDVFRQNRRLLRSTPGLDPKTGRVDCLSVITKP